MSTDQSVKKAAEMTTDALKRFLDRGKEAQEQTDKLIQNLSKKTAAPSPIEMDLNFRVGVVGGKVYIDFAMPVTDIYLTGNQAIQWGNALVKHGRKANKLKKQG